MRNFKGITILTILVAVIAHKTTGQDVKFVNPFAQEVEFEGWGTSLCWWADVLGNMPEDVIDYVMTAFFSEDSGLGMNIVRYTIGGTTPGPLICGPFRDGGATESYLDSAGGVYNWTRDARQRDILLRAKELGVDTFEAFSNSPPQWMTNSGCSKGTVGGGLLHSNFDSSRAPEFADYIANVLEHFSTAWGIDFQTYAPFNEPYGLQGIGGWLGASSSQEGCNMNLSTMSETIRVFSETFRTRNLSVELSVSDETQIDTAIVVQNHFRNQNLTNMINKINVHGYWDSKVAKRDKLYSNTLKDGHRLWMDEMGWGSTPITDMGQGLEIATRIITDLRNLLPSAWVYWQAMEDEGLWGLLTVPYSNPSLSNIRFNNGYFAFLQFSRYIKKGFSIVYTNEDNTVAAYDRNSETLVIVIVNAETASSSQEILFDLNLFNLNSSTAKVTITRTSTSEQHALVHENETNLDMNQKILKYTPPAQSVTTIKIENAGTAETTDLIKNGVFESSEFWTLSGTGTDINSVNSRRGQLSGVINTKDESGSISQSVKVDFTGRVYLSAWCSASKSNTTLSADINGQQIGSISIESGGLYKSYGLGLGQVNEGDIIDITFRADHDSSVSYIDDIILQAKFE